MFQGLQRNVWLDLGVDVRISISDTSSDVIRRWLTHCMTISTNSTRIGVFMRISLFRLQICVNGCFSSDLHFLKRFALKKRKLHICVDFCFFLGLP